MKKRMFGRKLKRDINERKALFKSLMNALILKERIKTTEAKAKSIKGEIERFVTKAKNKGEGARYHLLKHFPPEIVNKIMLNIAPRFKGRPGGYTRILRLGKREKDNAQMVMMEWVESSVQASVPVEEKKEDTKENKQTTDIKQISKKIFKSKEKKAGKSLTSNIKKKETKKKK